MPYVKVELPGLTLHNEFSRDQAFLHDLDNWHDGTDTLRDSEQRERGYGLYWDDDPAEAGRYPVVYGRLLSMRPGDEWTLRDQVMSLKSHDRFELVVTDPSGVWRSEVGVSGRIVFEIHDDGWADFEIPLEADDPRRYGPRQNVSTGVPTRGVGIADPVMDPVQEGEEGNLGRVTIQNGGTAPTEPIIHLDGGMSDGVELLCIERAEVIVITRPIPEGSTITVDNRSGVVWIDGQTALAASYLPVAEWFQVPPGSTCTIQWTPRGTITGTPQMRVEYAEASW